MPLVMGKHSYDPPQIMGESNQVVVGNFTSIARDVIVDCGFQHHTEFVTTYPFSCKFPNRFGSIKGYPYTKGDVIIGSDVWIGQNVVLMSGIKLGHGCVVGTNAVVTKDVEPFAIVGGVPAKLIKKRFTEDQISALLKISWWDWPDDKIFSQVPLLMSGDINNFIRSNNGVL